MGRRKRNRSLELKSMNMFEDAWIKDVSALSWAAQGFWFRVLLAMNRQVPRGVVPGTVVEFAAAMGQPASQARAWMADVLPMCEELEAKHIWSRAADPDIPGTLHPRAIVCRRMYRHWLEREQRVRAGKLGAAAKWGDGKRYGKGHGKRLTKPLANGMAGEKPGQPLDGESVTPKRKAVSDSKHLDKTMPTSSSSSSLRSKDLRRPQLNQGEEDPGRRARKTIRRDSKPQPIETSLNSILSHIHPTTQGLTLRDLMANTLERLTGDASFGKGRHRTRLGIIAASPGGIEAFDDLCDRLEKDVRPDLAKARGHDVILHPARFANSELMRIEKLATTEGAEK